MYLLGIDVSTTATKALLVDGEGRTVDVASSAYDLSTPQPLWAEQDPQLWWDAACAAIGRVIESSGDEMRETLGLKRLVRITGNDAFPGFTAPKLLWVRHHEPEVYERIRHVLLPKDYVRFCLTGEFATDRAGAGGTLLLDLARRDWSSRLLEALHIPPDWLPPTFEGTEITGHVGASAARLTGLAPGTPVVGGGGDQAAQAVGVGAVAPGVVALTLGTSGVVFAASDEPLVEKSGRLHAFPHAVPDTWHVMGVMLSAAGSLRWYRDVVAPDVDFDVLVDEASAVEPGAEGLTFLPYLHLTRAVLEGVAFGLRDNLSLMADVGLDEVDEVRVSGGGAKSPIWRQILADVLGVDLVTVETEEGAAFGAALLAGVGAGVWPSAGEASDAAVRLGETTRPDSVTRSAYEPVYQRFRAGYPALKVLFDE